MENEEFIKHEKLIYFVLSKLNIPQSHPEYEDLCQEGAIGLLKAIRTFDQNESCFSTYAAKCILNEIMCYGRKRKNKIKPLGFAVSDDGAEYVNNIHENFDLVSDFRTNEKIDYLCKNIEFGDIFYKIYIEGKTQKEIAKEYKCSQPQINRRLSIFLKEAQKIYKEI